MVIGQRGLSLVEMMVTVAVAGILALYGGSLTASWLGKQQLQATQEVLQQGYAKARSVALTHGANGASNSASLLLLTNKQLCVQNGDYTALNCTDALWQAQLAVDSITIAQQQTACIAFNSAGLPSSGVVNSQNCATSTQYSISKGSNNANGYLE
ncbi:type II secretion system protein [Shewanella avicenniae]|uniref:Type II secretion system protein n=1 Tax=Shewanella avicenniae TaxID=2814294 RepID=A0ABX7QMG6_9GAMM|nr:type II secretion system protein [Shewanella avicenniae]QSX32185.1 type II secretion system protein [Shewanella avicenniae]